ncbi:unnamed protein product [Microthlaspi erraticum]|uniref:Uncharacterized protein n=1 Tax=Microthlaspi erraticum TaxID=1685480 RepID=A0A6D2K0J3_9BRAS|nr:unnamed protein product [Microthlaspi erraticum]
MKSSAIKVNKAVKCQLDQELESSQSKLDRVEAWPVELRNSTGWSSGRSSWSSRWLLPSSFAYPVELLPCAKSLHAPMSHMLQNAPKDLFQRTKHAYCPPKNWETRSWSGDGRRPSGALHCNCSAHSIELALDSIELCLELPLFFLKPAPVRLSQEKS